MGITGFERIPHDHSLAWLQIVHLSPSAEEPVWCFRLQPNPGLISAAVGVTEDTYVKPVTGWDQRGQRA
ncbi:hypothetical protein GCM10009691_19780 [Brevibacterium picturae]|uniref:Uncharacterized protein n=1 Tax=Brevibacterium picturae TaxID=260553 RepID=A0ABP4MJE0_9MICO